MTVPDLSEYRNAFSRLDVSDDAIFSARDHRLTRRQVPRTPFTEWSSEHRCVCFNGNCPHSLRGWTALAGQGIPGSQGFMFDPDSSGCHSVPVLTPQSLRESIVPREDDDGLQGDD